MRASSHGIAYVVAIAAGAAGCQALLDLEDGRAEAGAREDAAVPSDATSPSTDASPPTPDGAIAPDVADAGVALDADAGGGVNIVVNGGFESGFDEWSVMYGSKTPLDAGAHDGAFAYELCGPENLAPSTFVVQNISAARAATGYTARAWVRTNGSVPSQAFISVRSADGGASVFNGLVPMTWGLLQGHDNRAVAAGDAMEIRIGFSSADGVGCMAVDDVSLELD